MGSIWCKTAQNVPSHRQPLLKFWGDKERALWYFMVLSGVVNTHTGAMIDSCVCQVPVPCPHCAHELPMGLRGRGKVS